MTVHLLHEGQALCGSPSGEPKSWPDGHRWMSIPEHKMMLDKAGGSRVDCDLCLLAASAPTKDEVDKAFAIVESVLTLLFDGLELCSTCGVIEARVKVDGRIVIDMMKLSRDIAKTLLQVAAAAVSAASADARGREALADALKLMQEEHKSHKDPRQHLSCPFCTGAIT